MNIGNKYLVSVSGSLGIPKEWLWNLIQFESKWNPKAVSRLPYNQKKLLDGSETEPRYAKGLIQFIDSTAQKLGYMSSQDLIDRNPSASQQLLFPVLQYLSKYKPFPTKQSFYLSVFYPAARNWPSQKEFPESVKKANPGINTPADYIKKVDKVEDVKNNSLLIFILIGVIILLKKK